MKIALDFDGVLHSYKQGFTGAADLPGAPVAGAREFVEAALRAGHEVIVYSCRARTPHQAAETELGCRWDPGGREAMQEWLSKHEFPPLQVTGTKPAASVYIDDRALTFRGTWPKLDKLAKFRPWEQANALSGLMGGMPRPQEILTPPLVTDFVRAVFGNLIELDPCAARDDRETVQAATRWYGPDLDSTDGLKTPWVDRTFANPPYGDLRKWLEKATIEMLANPTHRIVVLCPVRSRRPWWRVARDLARRYGTYVELNDLAFIGYESNFPESLCLMCFNVPVSEAITSVCSFGIGTIL